MAGLPSAQKREIAQRLRARERELYEDIQRELAKRQDYNALAGEVPDAGDAATADLIRDLDHAEVGRDLRELRAIGAALRRIPGEDYGECIECGQDIPLGRLHAQPSALRCAPCQSVYEKHHAGQGRGPTL